MNTFSAQYVDGLVVPVGTTKGPTVSMSLQKSTCLTLFIRSPLAGDGNTETINLEVQNPFTDTWVPSGVTPIVVSSATELIASLTLPAGCPKFRLSFTFAGVGPDEIEVVMCGLPQGYSIA